MILIQSKVLVNSLFKCGCIRKANISLTQWLLEPEIRMFPTTFIFSWNFINSCQYLANVGDFTRTKDDLKNWNWTFLQKKWFLSFWFEIFFLNPLMVLKIKNDSLYTLCFLIKSKATHSRAFDSFSQILSSAMHA